MYYFNNRDLVVLREARIASLRNSSGQTAGSKAVGSKAELALPNKKIQKSQEPIVEILAFVLMPNHYHLILKEIVEGGISSFMRKFGNGYTGYFNIKYDRVGMGGIFQSRYKSVSVKDDTQLNNVFVYVHTNPVELKEPGWKDLEVKDPQRALTWLDNYRWSSFHNYRGKPLFSSVIRNDFFLDFYGGGKDCYQAIKDWIMFKAGDIQFGPEI